MKTITFSLSDLFCKLINGFLSAIILGNVSSNLVLISTPSIFHPLEAAHLYSIWICKFRKKILLLAQPIWLLLSIYMQFLNRVKSGNMWNICVILGNWCLRRVKKKLVTFIQQVKELQCTVFNNFFLWQIWRLKTPRTEFGDIYK